MGKANSQTNPKSTNNKFWQFRNLADDDQKAELLLYGDISERSWWEDAATPKRFADDLAALGGESGAAERAGVFPAGAGV